MLVLLYILTALKCEASVLNGLPGEIIVTGVGEKAMEAVNALSLNPSDKVLNVGICGGVNRGRGYLVNQVISEETGRRFYPDILFEAGIQEKTLTTVKEFVNDIRDGTLYDMESSIICEKVLKTIAPSNIAIYKVVSDNGRDFPSPKQVMDLIRNHLTEIKKIARALLENGDPRSYSFLPSDLEEKLYLTHYMKNELKDIEHYCVVAGREKALLDLLKKMEDMGKLPAKDKKAGREVLDEIYSYLR